MPCVLSTGSRSRSRNEKAAKGEAGGVNPASCMTGAIAGAGFVPSRQCCRIEGEPESGVDEIGRRSGFRFELE